MRLPLFGLAIIVTGCTRSLPPFDAAREPDKAAWTLFADINRPVRNGESRWETWATPDQLFPDYGGHPQWPASTPPKKFEQLLQQLMLDKIVAGTGRLVPLDFDPKEVKSNSEVHLNCPTFVFVVDNGLWRIEGQTALIRDIQAGKRNQIEFPPQSIATKAVWKRLDKDDPSRFHTTVVNGETWGLIAFHLTSKRLPKWLWATWEHVDVVHPERKDSFGFPVDSGRPSPELESLFRLAGLKPKWLNYRLVGSQTDFNDSMGRPTALGNAIIEDKILPDSSCVTCHSLSARDQGGGPSVPSAVLDRPDYKLFAPIGPQQFFQMDFLWTLTRRAHNLGLKPASVKPPDCSKLP